MELGNAVINRIYEARIRDECELKPATENCDISVREAWIKAKYVEKRFICVMPKPQELLCGETAEVLSIEEKSDGETNSNLSKTTTLSLGARKWAVKKFRRRRQRHRSSSGK